MIFVDTGAWFAAAIPDDPDHEAAASFLRQNRQRLVTTDYILDETLTLFKRRGEISRALSFATGILDGRSCQLEWVRPVDVQQAWQVFQSYRDKKWSFTDCVSMVVMTRLKITMALAFDEHFRQFGTVAVVP